MDLIRTYPRRLAVFAALTALLIFGLRGPVAYLNVWRAEQEIMVGRKAWAMSEYRRGLFLTPLDSQLLTAVGFLFSKQGDGKRAVESFRAAVAADPKTTEPLYFLAFELRRSNDLTGAADALRESVRRDPTEDRTWRLLAIVYAKQGRTREAIEAWREDAKRFPAAKAVAEENIRSLEAKSR